MQPYTSAFLKAQAQRTAPTRHFFYQYINWKMAPICLDIGCGTGVITHEFTHKGFAVKAIGLDIDSSLLSKAYQDYPPNSSLHYILADATFLPFRKAIASICLSHFTMMWISARIQALKEIHHILCPKGVFASIEPDYTRRIEISKERTTPPTNSTYPIIHALQKLGADPYTGSHLPSELEKLSYQNIRSGVLSWQFDADEINAEIRDEAAILKELGFNWVLPLFTYTPVWWSLATT